MRSCVDAGWITFAARAPFFLLLDMQRKVYGAQSYQVFVLKNYFKTWNKYKSSQNLEQICSFFKVRLH